MLVDLQRVLQRWGRKLFRPKLPTLVGAQPPRSFLPATHQEAAQSLIDRPTVESVPYRNRCLSVSREGSDALIVDFAVSFVRELNRRGMPFFVHCYVRDNETQKKLFRQGVTKARAGQSPHNWGMAVDIIHYHRAWDITNKQWAVIGLIGKEVARRRNIKISWGGDWSFYDPAHWELSDWKKRIAKQ